MRLRTAAAVAAATVLSAGMAAVAAGRYASAVALTPSRTCPLPTEEPLTVHAAESGKITLTRSLTSLRPGVYGLTGEDCHAVVGPVIEGAPHPADAVVRRLVRVTRGTVEPGMRLRLTPQVHTGNPREALGLDYTEVGIPGELGTLPAWFVPGTRGTWVIAVHGLGTTREHSLVLLPFLHRFQLPVLAPAYRGDPGAPRCPDGIGHLGYLEWRDLDAAVHYAVRHGAQRVVLHGWSIGATMALHAVAGSALRQRIAGLVMDSPVLDWQATLRALAALGGIPRPLLPLAVRAAQGRTGLPAHRPAQVPEPATLPVPTLIVHGPHDTIAPWQPSRALADRHTELVTLHTVAQAPHAAMWNVSPPTYEEALRRFLTPLM